MSPTLLRRREVVAALLAERGDLVCIAGLGAPAWDITAAGDTPLNLPLWGGMGGAVPIGLGLALARPERPVLVVTGDGEMLMGLGALATVAVQAPRNLSIVVLDNERYGETGGQPSHTGSGVDLVGIAHAAGFAHSAVLPDLDAVRTFRGALRDRAGPRFGLAKVDPETLPLVLPPREGAVLQARMRSAILGAAAELV